MNTLRDLLRQPWLAICALALTLVACDSGPQPSASAPAASPAPSVAAEPARGSGAAFSVLAGSELKELESALVAAAREIGIPLEVSYAGTLDIVERINAGEKFDAILPPNGAYPALALTKPPVAREKLFYSRVALGIKADVAQRLGWDSKAPTWADIARAARDGQLRYAMTNPSSSNTGMSALFAIASAAAGKTEDLTVAEIDAELLRGFLVGQKLTAGSSGWLADSFAQDDSTVDAIVNYEAVLLRLNRARSTPLTLIYPQDGVISADYPLMLLDDSRRADYDALVQHLKAGKFQGGPVRDAWLRPSNPDISPDPALPVTAVAELAFPNQLAVIDAVLTAYQGELRRPATSIFVLDTSGSMRGERLDQLKEALVLLSGARASAASQRYAAFQTRERIVLLPFSGSVGKPEQIEYSQATLAADQQRVIDYSGALRAQGQTAIYDALQRAIALAESENGGEGSNERFVSIVLLSDGENTAGTDFASFSRSPALAALREARIRIFPILFGEASQQEMQQLAELTGGRMFDARSSELPLIFKEIRGYQ